MTDNSKQPPRDLKSGTNPIVRAQFTNELTQFLESKIRSSEAWPGLNNDDLISGIIASVKSASKHVPHGMGFALLMALSLAAQDEALNFESNTDINDPAPMPNNKEADLESPQPLVNSVQNTKIQEENFLPISFAGQTQSPLFRLGYSVAAGGPSEARRHVILMDAFESNAGNLFSSHEVLAKWGEPKSHRRLFALASFIKWLIDFQGSEKPQAEKKWRADLNWLKASFYKSSMPFHWPQPYDVTQRNLRTPFPEFMTPMTPSPALAAIIGSTPSPRTEITKRVWEYIKLNRLQDDTNRRIINADTKLLEVFGKRQVTMFEMTKLINAHLS